MARGITSMGGIAPPITNELLTFHFDAADPNGLKLFGPEGYPWLYRTVAGATNTPGGYVTQLKNQNNVWADVTQEPHGLGDQVDINQELQYYCRQHEIDEYNLPAMKFIENGELVLRNHLTPDNFKDVAICSVDRFGDFRITSANEGTREIVVEGRKYERRRPSDDGSYPRGDYMGFDKFFRDELYSDPNLDTSWKRKKYTYAWISITLTTGVIKKVKYELVVDSLATDELYSVSGGIPSLHTIRLVAGELTTQEWSEIVAGSTVKLFRRLPWIGVMMTTGGTFSQKYFIAESKMKLGDHKFQFFAWWFWGNYLKMFGQAGFDDYQFDYKHSNATELDAIEQPGAGKKATKVHNLHAAQVGGMLNYAGLNNIPPRMDIGLEWDKDDQAGHTNYITENTDGYVDYQQWFRLQVRWIPPYHPDNLRSVGVVEWYIGQGDSDLRFLCGAITPPWWDSNPGLAKQMFINNAVGGTFVNDTEYVYAVGEGSTINTDVIENRIKYIKVWQYPQYITGGAGYPDKDSNFSRGFLPTPFDPTGNSGSGTVPGNYNTGVNPPPVVSNPETDPVVVDPVTGRIRTLILVGSELRDSNTTYATVEQLQELAILLRAEYTNGVLNGVSTSQLSNALNALEAEINASISNISLTPGVPGEAGISAYEEWLTIPGNENKTITEYYVALKGPKGDIGTGSNAPLSSNPDLNDGTTAADTVATKILAERIANLSIGDGLTLADIDTKITAYNNLIRGASNNETLVSLRTDIASNLITIQNILSMLTTDVAELDTVNERINAIQALITQVENLNTIDPNTYEGLLNYTDGRYSLVTGSKVFVQSSMHPVHERILHYLDNTTSTHEFPVNLPIGYNVSFRVPEVLNNNTLTIQIGDGTIEKIEDIEKVAAEDGKGVISFTGELTIEKINSNTWRQISKTVFSIDTFNVYEATEGKGSFASMLSAPSNYWKWFVTDVGINYGFYIRDPNTGWFNVY